METLIAGGVALVVLLFIYKSFMTFLARKLNKREVPSEARNGLVWLIRIITLIAAIAIILWGIGVETITLGVFAGVATIAITFASQQVLGNLVSGIYIMIARPFRVGDYIMLGPEQTIEGIVRQITVNYVLIENMYQNYFSIVNQEILSKEILNIRFQEGKEVLYRYSIELDFDFSLSLERTKKIFSDIVEHHKSQFAKPPEYYPLGITNRAMKFVFIIYVKDPQDLYTLKPQLIAEILQAREKAKTQEN